MAVVWTVVSTTMFSAQMEFFAKIADPAIGGSYMTLLNTVANMGNTWWAPTLQLARLLLKVC